MGFVCFRCSFQIKSSHTYGITAKISKRSIFVFVALSKHGNNAFFMQVASKVVMDCSSCQGNVVTFYCQVLQYTIICVD